MEGQLMIEESIEKLALLRNHFWEGLDTFLGRSGYFFGGFEIYFGVSAK